MFLCCHTGQRLEPMGIMCCALLDCPFLHFMCNNICSCKIQICSLFDGLLQFLIHFLRKSFLHHSIIEYIFTENISDFEIFTHLLDSSLFSYFYSPLSIY